MWKHRAEQVAQINALTVPGSFNPTVTELDRRATERYQLCGENTWLDIWHSLELQHLSIQHRGPGVLTKRRELEAPSQLAPDSGEESQDEARRPSATHMHIFTLVGSDTLCQCVDKSTPCFTPMFMSMKDHLLDYFLKHCHFKSKMWR